MINLLPPDVKQSRTYGRRNRILARWCVISLLAIAALGAIAGSGYFFINNAEKSARQLKNQNESATQTKEFTDTEKDYAAFTSNLKTVIQILSKQVLFSDLIRSIGSVTPTGAKLSTVSLSDADNALDLNFIVTDSSVASVIQLNLEDEEIGLFESADINSVVCTPEEGCTVSVRALYKDTANFLFLNTVGGQE